MPNMHSHYHFCCRWLQIAKKMLAKSKKEGGSGFESSGKGSNTNGRRPLPHPASGQSLATVGQTYNPPFFISLNPLSSNFQSSILTSFSTSSLPGGPGGRRSPSNVPAHLQRQRERPHPGLQLQPLKALARGQGAIQS